MSLQTGRGVGPSAALLAVLVVALLPVSAEAQYFGRQKVQYESFDWQVMQTPRFQIHYYPETEQVTRDAARMAERWYTRLSQVFQHEFESKPLILYADHPDFQQTNVIGDQLTEGTGGVTESLRTRVIMPYTGVYAENDHVLGHELVHVFQYDMAAASPATGGLMGLSRLPLFLIEGMAEYLSLGRDDAHTAMWLRDAALLGELPTLEQMARDQRYFPYRYGQALWAYIAGRWGDRAVTEVFRFATRNGIEPALSRVLGVTHQQLSQDWIAATRETYLPALEGRQRPQDAGDPILVDNEKGAMNLSPAISPDGRHVAFFGRRNVFTVDLFVADAETGEVVKTLTSPNRSEHFDALSFIQSAGSWSPDGQRFAFPVFEAGDNRLAILNVGSGNVERRIAVEGVGAIQNPAWSPDGRTIAISGMRGGISDLYLVDLETETARQITDDRYADLQPAWSPDGRTIAFASDRSAETDFDALVFGRMILATYDVASGRVEPITAFQGRKHINPQYSPDGRSLYFVADPNGFSDVYRMDLASREVFQVTRIATGVSGISALSPAMSIAADNGRMMFSVFENSGNNIYGLPAERTLGERVTDTPDLVAIHAGTLPPVDAAGSGVVADYLNAPLEGLPPVAVDYETRDYKGGIGLDYLGPPSFGVGSSSFGPVVGGGVSAYFGDMLGNHQIGAAIQANGTLKDIGGQAVYMNLSNRLNWGVGVGHIPYITGFTRLYFDDFGGQTYRVVDQVIERVFVTQASLLSRYPFSTTQRVELSGGYTRYGFDREIDRYITDDFGRVINFERIDTASTEPLGFVETSAALVGDNSFFGFVSPVVGRRYRLEVSPTFGTLSYYSVTADYRRYFQMQPFTFAFRGLHYGRYGKDADGISEERNQRILNDLFVGYEHLIRGYDYNSFSGGECRASPDQPGGCPVIDRLFGTRMAVASMELRLPLLGFPQAGLGLINFPFLPTEIAPFVDMGLAWSAGDDPVLAFKTNTFERVPVFSAGMTARMNLFGYFVLEAYYAYPFQRPDKGGHFGFQLMPGW